MNKTELTKLVAEKQKVSKRKAGTAIGAVFESLVEALQRGEKIQIKDFGNFTTRERKARKGINPRTKEPIDVPAQRSVTFKAAKTLVESLKPAGEHEQPPPDQELARQQQPPQQQPREEPKPPGPVAGGPIVDPSLGRRRHHRAPVEIKVEYFLLDKFISDFTHNISQGGIFIRTRALLGVGTELSFKLFVPPLTEPLAVAGRVAWVRTPEQAASQQQAPGMGIQFVYQSEEERIRSERLMNNLIAGTAKAPAPEPTDVESRRHPRIPVQLKVEYEDIETFITEYVRNISKGGVFIRSDQVLEKGTEFVFKLHVPMFLEPVTLKGRVAWVRTPEQATGSKQPGMGVKFVYDSEEEQFINDRIVESLLKRHLEAQDAER